MEGVDDDEAAGGVGGGGLVKHKKAKCVKCKRIKHSKQINKCKFKFIQFETTLFESV